MKIRDGNVVNRPIYLALSVTGDGARDILGPDSVVDQLRRRSGHHGPERRRYPCQVI